MALPRAAGRTETVTVAGEPVEVRALTLAEVRRIQACDDDLADATAIALGVGCTTEEATEWLADTPADVAAELMAAIFRLSGLDKEASKSG